MYVWAWAFLLCAAVPLRRGRGTMGKEAWRAASCAPMRRTMAVRCGCPSGMSRASSMSSVVVAEDEGETAGLSLAGIPIEAPG